ncbi:MAG: hypothetical protein K9G11_04220 [Rickettsiaceae bacterium]|nr:hypothetical protein [Rickettsiaceae bacterium]
MSANENQSPQKQSKEVRNEGTNLLNDYPSSTDSNQKNRFLCTPLLLETTPISDMNDCNMDIIQATHTFETSSE